LEITGMGYVPVSGQAQRAREIVTADVETTVSPELKPQPMTLRRVDDLDHGGGAADLYHTVALPEPSSARPLGETADDLIVQSTQGLTSLARRTWALFAASV
jgi:hypothetical protein